MAQIQTDWNFLGLEIQGTSGKKKRIFGGTEKD
jgi:hypothetical protein